MHHALVALRTHPLTPRAGRAHACGINAAPGRADWGRDLGARVACGHQRWPLHGNLVIRRNPDEQQHRDRVDDAVPAIPVGNTTPASPVSPFGRLRLAGGSAHRRDVNQKTRLYGI